MSMLDPGLDAAGERTHAFEAGAINCFATKAALASFGQAQYTITSSTSLSPSPLARRLVSKARSSIHTAPGIRPWL